MTLHWNVYPIGYYCSVPHLIAQRWPPVHNPFHLSLISAPPPSHSHLPLNLLFLCPSFHLSSILSPTPYRLDASFTQWLGRWTRKLGGTLFLVICLPTLSFRLTLSPSQSYCHSSPLHSESRLPLIPLFSSSHFFHSLTVPYLPSPPSSFYSPSLPFPLFLPCPALLYPVLSCPVLFFSVSQSRSVQ
jgi:hypothetical protein